MCVGLVAAACGSSDDNSSGGNKQAGSKPQAGKGAFNQPDTSGGTPQAGGTLTFGLESDVASLDPSKALAQPPDIDIALSVYDPLVSFDANGKAIPFLAESITKSTD